MGVQAQGSESLLQLVVPVGLALAGEPQALVGAQAQGSESLLQLVVLVGLALAGVPQALVGAQAQELEQLVPLSQQVWALVGVSLALE